MKMAPINPLEAWGQATDEGKAKAQAMDAEREQRIDQAVSQVITNCAQAVGLLQARSEHGRLLRFVQALNLVLSRALNSIPDEGGAE